VAGGRLTRQALLAQLAPGGAESLPAAERVSVLITTDLLSEGVNLQDASVIVHADLPWSPARFEQRVGRVRRLQSRHAEVFVYALRPPAPAERLLRMEARLREKLAAAARTVGVRGTILPRLFPAATDSPPPPPAAQADARIVQTLSAWPATAWASGDGVLVGAVRRPRAGFLALVERGGRPELVAGLDGRISDAPAHVLEALVMAGGPEAPIDAAGAARAVAALGGWLESRSSSAVLDFAAGSVARMRRRVLHRIDMITTRSPRHLRSRFVPLARDARRVATATFAAGAERVLEELADARMSDEAWLRAVGTFAELNARAAVEGGVVAMLLFVKCRRLL
jgi:Helicase conserved C-terminal domain